MEMLRRLTPFLGWACRTTFRGPESLLVPLVSAGLIYSLMFQLGTHDPPLPGPEAWSQPGVLAFYLACSAFCGLALTGRIWGVSADRPGTLLRLAGLYRAPSLALLLLLAVAAACLSPVTLVMVIALLKSGPPTTAGAMVGLLAGPLLAAGIWVASVINIGVSTDARSLVWRAAFVVVVAATIRWCFREWYVGAGISLILLLGLVFGLTGLARHGRPGLSLSAIRASVWWSPGGWRPAPRSFLGWSLARLATFGVVAGVLALAWVGFIHGWPRKGPLPGQYELFLTMATMGAVIVGAAWLSHRSSGSLSRESLTLLRLTGRSTRRVIWTSTLALAVISTAASVLPTGLVLAPGIYPSPANVLLCSLLILGMSASAAGYAIREGHGHDRRYDAATLILFLAVAIGFGGSWFLWGEDSLGAVLYTAARDQVPEFSLGAFGFAWAGETVIRIEDRLKGPFAYDSLVVGLPWMLAALAAAVANIEWSTWIVRRDRGRR